MKNLHVIKSKQAYWQLTTDSVHRNVWNSASILIDYFPTFIHLFLISSLHSDNSRNMRSHYMLSLDNQSTQNNGRHKRVHPSHRNVYLHILHNKHTTRWTRSTPITELRHQQGSSSEEEKNFCCSNISGRIQKTVITISHNGIESIRRISWRSVYCR